MNAVDVVDRTPFELAARLEADEFFVDIPVVVAEEGNVEREIARKQGVITTKTGKRGVVVILLQIIADDIYHNLQFDPMLLRPVFQVIENVELNRDANGTGKSYRKVARRIRDVMKIAGIHGVVKTIIPDTPCIEPVQLVAELGNSRSCLVKFTCLEDFGEQLAQTQRPIFAVIGGDTPQLEITTATEDAEIWFTLDDSYPSPVNPTAKLYASPIDLPAEGLLIRACTYKPGLIASWVVRAEIAP